jgi:hypothetical protein
VTLTVKQPEQLEPEGVNDEGETVMVGVAAVTTFVQQQLVQV